MNFTPVDPKQSSDLRFNAAPGWVHAFRMALDLPDERVAALGETLSGDERERAARFRFASDRRRFAAARGQVREILGAFLGVSPEAVCFTYNPHGKPALAASPRNEPRFNLSHSQGLGLLGVVYGREVGVDLESTRRKVETPNIARRFFAPGEAEALFALPPEEQSLAFFHCWTRKEAYIKARGQGLSIPLDSFEVTLAPGAAAELRSPEPGWSLRDLVPGPGFTAALVVSGKISGLSGWDWGPEPGAFLAG